MAIFDKIDFKMGQAWSHSFNRFSYFTGIDISDNIWSQAASFFGESIRARVRLALVVAIVGLIGMGITVAASNILLLNSFKNNVEEMNEGIEASHNLGIKLNEAERLAELYIVRGYSSTLAKYRKVAVDVDRHFQILSKHISENILDHQFYGLKKIEHVSSIWKKNRDLMLLGPRSRVSGANMSGYRTEVNPAISPASNLIFEFHSLAMKEMKKELIAAETLARKTYQTIFLSILVAFVLLVSVTSYICTSILRPIRKLHVGAVRLSNKDFSYRVNLRNTKDELGQLGNAFNDAASCLQKLYEELELRSSCDGLTGVMNRASFDERLRTECNNADRHKRPLSLLMVDIDFFKLVNDHYGHQAGDEVLRTLANILEKTTRPADVVARYGGEEFSVILPDTDDESAMAMAQRLRKAIENTTFNCPASVNIYVTASFGCATRESDKVTTQDLVKAADDALYRAKESGRNCAISAKGMYQEPAMDKTKTRNGSLG